MQDPAEGTAEGNELYGSNLELHQLRILGFSLMTRKPLMRQMVLKETPVVTW